MGSSDVVESLTTTGDPLRQWKDSPDDWEEIKLWDLAEYINGRAFKPTDFSKVGLRVIKITELKYGISSDTALYEGDYDDKYLLETGDLLFAWSGNPETSLDAFIWQDGQALLNQHIFRVIPRKGIDKQYLYFLLKFLRPTFIRTARDKATSMGHVKVSDLKRLIAWVPHLIEQRTIACILGSLDDKIKLNTQMSKTLEEIGQVLFKHWFVDFEFPNGEGKPYKSSGGEMVDSELGEIPKGWKADRLGDYVNIIKGCSYRSEYLQDSDKALVTLKSIERGGGFKSEGLKPYSGEYKQEQIISPGELVVAHTDLTQKAEVLGKPAIVREVPLYSTLIASLDLSVVRPKNDSMNVPFVYFLLKTEDFQNHAYGYADGTTVLHLNKKAVPDYKFVIPQKDLVKKFGKIIIGLLDKIQNNELESEVLISIRDALLPKLMSGEIRIKDIDKSAEEVFTC